MSNTGMMSTREALALVRAHGAVIINGHGDEIRVDHELLTRRINIKSTRKDCPRCLLTLVNRIRKKLRATA